MKTIQLRQARQDVEDYIDELWLHMWNSSWELIETKQLEVIDEVFDALLDEQPDDKKKYIKEYLTKHYPYNIIYKNGI